MAKLKSAWQAKMWEAGKMPLRAKIFADLPKQAQRVAGPLAPLANRIARSMPGQVALERLGITTERALPDFARHPFEGRDTPSANGQPRVVLYADTFSRHMEPEVAQAAQAVLEAAGFAVVVPPYRCCGRTYLSKGVLGRAKELAREAVDTLAPYAEAGLPIVGLEPSCVLTLRDEFLSLLPGDERALAVAEVAQTFEEFVAAKAETFRALSWEQNGSVLLHGHCHQKALSGIAPSRACLEAAGFAVTFVDAGCCGMAGSFGYEAEHVKPSRAMAERVLAPAVRAAAPETHVVAAGTSCRHQIADTTGRAARHPAELMHDALELE
jgi:Fe-S oxidoreductase